MSQARGAARRQTQQIYELGQAGRKTGVILPDNGQRDENGLQPLDGLFSSPTKPDGSTPRAIERSVMGEQDMEIDQASSPGPSTIMRNRRSGASVLPISRSPVRTSLGSPALKNPHLTARPSPARPASRLRGNGDSATTTAPAANKDNQQTISRNLFAAPKSRHPPRPNGTSRSRRFFPVSDEDEDEDDDDVLQPPAQGDIFDESMEMIEEFVPQSDAPQPPDDREEQQEPTPRPTKRSNRSSGQPLNKAAPPKPSSKPATTTANKHGPLKRSRQPEPEPQTESDDDENEEEQEEEEGLSSPSIQAPVNLPPPNPPRRQASRSSQPVPPTKPPPTTTTSKSTSSASASKARVKPSPAQTLNRKARVSGRSKKTTVSRSSAAIGSKASKNDDNDNDGADKSLLEVQRGPPPPKRRGLMSVRTNDNVTTTRSGRTSYAPLQFWKGERAEIATETFHDANSKQAFVLAATKEIIRVEDDDPPPPSKRRRTARPAGRRAASAASANTSARRVASGSGAGQLPPGEPLEEWERDPGVVDGDVVLWTYEHEINPPGPDEEVGIITEQLAIASGAVETREIKDATFRYAKTMSLGFMGSGIVDLPPGSEKRPKNSRRMQLVFFVVSGKVKVTIHDNEFRIGAGGQFFVPRGNYYSIVNDYDSPARIFFAQACEMEMQQYEEGEQAEEAPEEE